MGIVFVFIASPKINLWLLIWMWFLKLLVLVQRSIWSLVRLLNWLWLLTKIFLNNFQCSFRHLFFKMVISILLFPERAWANNSRILQYLFEQEFGRILQQIWLFIFLVFTSILQIFVTLTVLHVFKIMFLNKFLRFNNICYVLSVLF